MTTPAPGRHIWVDASAGVAGDMLLGALVDAGASLAALQRAVDAVLPSAVALSATPVVRSGLRATKVHVTELTELAASPAWRSWTSIRAMIERADLSEAVRESALATFAALATAEGRVHGVPPHDVHFHEVGAWDSIADIVGVCAALDELGVGSMTVSTVALGSGRIQIAHGEIPVPVPAVLELVGGWRVTSGGDGELTTPTGMALLATLASGTEELPDLVVETTGTGAGTRDTPGRPNVVRVVIGRLAAGPGVDAEGTRDHDVSAAATSMSVLETNVDDLDARVWPTVLSALMEAGAADAWLVPILMKKGRPAHTLKVLTGPTERNTLRRLMFELTSTIGVREVAVERVALNRSSRVVRLGDGAEVRIKVALEDGRIVHCTTEFEDALAVATRRQVPVRQVLDEAGAAAQQAGLVPGAAFVGT